MVGFDHGSSTCSSVISSKLLSGVQYCLIRALMFAIQPTAPEMTGMRKMSEFAIAVYWPGDHNFSQPFP